MLLRKCALFVLSCFSIAGLTTVALAGSGSMVFGWDPKAPGTFLVFPKFDIRGEGSTQLRIVNGATSEIDVKLFYICPGELDGDRTCHKLDRLARFTPFQTRIISVRDQNPPCERGYVIGYAQEMDGTPVSHNYLTGSYLIDYNHRQVGDNAITIQSTRETGSPLGVDGEFQFGPFPSPDSQDFVDLTRDRYIDFKSVCGDNGEPEDEDDGGGGEEAPEEDAEGEEGESYAECGSKLILLSLNTLAGHPNPVSKVDIDFWNEAEEPFSSSHHYVCWDERRLDEIDANFLSENLGSDHGAMHIMPSGYCPISGGCPPLQPFVGLVLGAIEEFSPGARSIRQLFRESQQRAEIPEEQEPTA